MTDHFGRSLQSQGGTRGPPGESGITTLCTVLPGTVITNLRRYDEPYCFTITRPSKDFIEDNSKWISRGENANRLTLLRGTIKLRELNMGTRWSVVMKNAMFSSPELTFAVISPNSTGFYCLTFLTKSDEEQVIISTFHDVRHDAYEIRCTSSEIIVKCGKVEEIIQHNVRRWTTLYLEYTSSNHIIDWRYTIDNNSLLSGSFTSPVQTHFRSGFTLGARKNSPGKEDYLDGEIASFETYEQDGQKNGRDDVTMEAPLCNTTPVPVFLKDLVYKYQKVEEDFHSF